jgi:hypothetical protein
MTDDEIRAAIISSPELRALIESGNDQAVADALSLNADPVPTGELYSERALFNELGPIVAESIMAKLEQFAAGSDSSSSVVARGLKWLQPDQGGIDFQNLALKQMLTGLQVAGVLTADELAALTSLGLRPGVVLGADVSRAVAPWRPDGVVAPIPTENN